MASKTIILVEGQKVSVDTEDLRLLADYYLHYLPSGYIQCVVRGYANRKKRVYLHRLVLGLTDPKKQVDHIDRDKLNNQKRNLRVVNNSVNQHNNPHPKNYWYDKRRNAFIAEIMIEGKKK